eukprot:685127-Pleurochrysis_carterae.AAC.1
MSDASSFVVHVNGLHAALVEISGQVSVPLDAAAQVQHEWRSGFVDQVRCHYCCGLPTTTQDAVCNCSFAIVVF